jgi:hypothetical protein
MAGLLDTKWIDAWTKRSGVQPRQVFAARAAIRVLPLLFSADKTWIVENATKVLRTSFLTWIYLQTPKRENFNNLSQAFSSKAKYELHDASRVARSVSYAARSINKTRDIDAPNLAAFYANEAFKFSLLNEIYRLDCTIIEQKTVSGMPLRDVCNLPIWPAEQPTNWPTVVESLFETANTIDPNFSFWIEWYQNRLFGKSAAFDITNDQDGEAESWLLGQISQSNTEEFWNKGAYHINAMLQSWLDEARERAAKNPKSLELLAPAETAEALLQQASPQARITNGKLDAAPNATFDMPRYSDNLVELPSELLAYTNTILNSLPTNCAAIVRNCFLGFRDELLVRGNRPILNIVKAMAASLMAQIYGTPDLTLPPDQWKLKSPQEWDAGMDSMFAAFFKGYHDLIHHFPLDIEREEFIAATPIDELAASGQALTEPVDAVAAMIVDLGKQGFATENIVRIIEAHQLYNRDVAQLPTPNQPSDAITPKRRHVLGTAGFYLHTYSVLGSTASLASWPAFQTLLPKLKDAIDALLGFIR